MNILSRRGGSIGFMRRLPMTLVALVLLLVPIWAQAQGMSMLPAADQQTIRNYNLNDDVFNRLIAVTKEARLEGIAQIRPKFTPSMTWRPRRSAVIRELPC